MDVFLETETKKYWLVNFFSGISDDKGKERKMVQRFLRANEMLSDKIYITIEMHGNFLITRLNTLLATTGTQEQQFGDIKQRTYLSAQAEESAFRLIAYVTVLDFLTQAQQMGWPIFEMINKEMEKRENTEEDNCDLNNCPKCDRFHTGNCVGNRNDPIRMKTQVLERIIRNIRCAINIVNTERRFNEQWNLMDAVDSLGFKCGEIIRPFLELINKRNKSHKPSTKDQSMDWEFHGNSDKLGNYSKQIYK